MFKLYILALHRILLSLHVSTESLDKCDFAKPLVHSTTIHARVVLPTQCRDHLVGRFKSLDVLGVYN